MRKKPGFTLAELMIVMLVITILLAAFAPIITKRQMIANRNRANVWNWITIGSDMDAYFLPNSASDMAISYFNTEGSKDTLLAIRPYGKLTVKANGNKPVQFSFYDERNFLGKWIMDRSNILLGGTYNSLTVDARNNIAIGKNSLTGLTSGMNNTVVVTDSAKDATYNNSNTVIGSKSTSGNNDNVHIGYNIGLTGGRNVVIKSQGTDEANGSGSNNVYIGAKAGNSKIGDNNVAIGYAAMGKKFSYSITGENNVAIGAQALENLNGGNNNTAIGYNACSELSSGSYVTCLGANSGPHSGTSAASVSDLRVFDIEHQRTYIGGKPKNFGGDAVLEIHNIKGTNQSLINKPEWIGNTTTVINGNLMVRGKIYFTFGNNLYAPALQNIWSYKYLMANKVCLTNNDEVSNTTCPDLPKTVSSDARLKNNISNNNDGIEKISKINVYNYNFKSDKAKKTQVGVIAQELQKVFPNSVSKDNKGYLQIRWDEMFFAMVNAIKDLNKKITQAIKDIVTLESQISKLEKENAQLKAQTNTLNLRVQKLKKN